MDTNRKPRRPQTTSEPCLNKHRATMVVTKVAARFPDSGLFRMISDPAMLAMVVNEWAEGMHGFTDAAIVYGLQQLNRQVGNFAPSLPSFLDLCLPVQRCHQVVTVEHERKRLAHSGQVPALTCDTPQGERFSLYVHELRKGIEQDKRLKHADDDLDEKKRRFMESLNHVMESKR